MTRNSPPIEVSPSAYASASRRLTLTTGILSIALLVAAGIFIAELGFLSLLTNILIFVALAQAWNILGGYGGYLNFGMAAFFGIGAYTTGVLVFQLSWQPLLTVPVAGIAAALFALLIGYPTLRVRGAYFAILTLLITFVVQLAVFNIPFTRGAMGIYITPPPVSPRIREQIFYFSFLALALLATFLVRWIDRSRLGAALVAIREDEDAAVVLGIRAPQLKMAAFAVGAAIAGIAGSLHGYRLAYVEPIGLFSLDISIDVVLMTFIGGAGTWLGPILGVPLVMMLAEVLRVGVTRLEVFGSRVPNEANRLILGVVLVLVALYARDGIMGLFKRVRRRQLTV